MLGIRLTQFVPRFRRAPVLILGTIFALTGTGARAQELAISAGFTPQQPLGPKDRIELKLNRPLAAAEGKLAVMIGQTDVSALLEVQPGAVGYSPRLPLPAG